MRGVGVLLPERAAEPAAPSPGVDGHASGEAVDQPVLLHTEVTVFPLLLDVITPLIRRPRGRKSDHDRRHVARCRSPARAGLAIQTHPDRAITAPVLRGGAEVLLRQGQIES